MSESKTLRVPTKVASPVVGYTNVRSTEQTLNGEWKCKSMIVFLSVTLGIYALCGCKVDGDSFTSPTIHGGKTVSYDFECEHCNSHYIVGLERTCKPIKSEILIDGTKTKTSCDLTKRYTNSPLRREK